MSSVRYKVCETCKYFDLDRSTGTSDCLCDDITEEELDKHYTNAEENCPHWVELYEGGYDDYIASLVQGGYIYE